MSLRIIYTARFEFWLFFPKAWHHIMKASLLLINLALHFCVFTLQFRVPFIRIHDTHEIISSPNSELRCQSNTLLETSSDLYVSIDKFNLLFSFFFFPNFFYFWSNKQGNMLAKLSIQEYKYMVESFWTVRMCGSIYYELGLQFWWGVVVIEKGKLCEHLPTYFLFSSPFSRIVECGCRNFKRTCGCQISK